MLDTLVVFRTPRPQKLPDSSGLIAQSQWFGKKQLEELTLSQDYPQPLLKYLRATKLSLESGAILIKHFD